MGRPDLDLRVFVIDDDQALRGALANLLRSAGHEVATFSSPKDFLEHLRPSDRGCLLLDIHFPHENGLEFQTRFLLAEAVMPVIIMTGHADVASSIRGMKSGATDFLIKPFDDTELLVFLYELKADLNAYLARLGPGAPVHTLQDIIDFNDRNRQHEMPYFGQDLFIKAQAKGPLTDKEYVDALAKNHQLARTEGIDALMDKHQLDAIVAPTGGPAWLTDLVNGDHVAGGSSNAAAVAGYPNLNVTAGSLSGLPVGISFFGRAWSEPTLIKLAYSFEQATRARQAPKFLPTVSA